MCYEIIKSSANIQDLEHYVTFHFEHEFFDSLIKKVNNELDPLSSIYKFHFISNENITRKYLCGDGVHLNEACVNILVGNIVNYLNKVILIVNINKLYCKVYCKVW